jgi:REP element-mobilizing transposase RayT
VSFTRRRLPHWQPDGKALFLTWRLHDTLPPNCHFDQESLTTGRAFVCFDRYLDSAAYGPTWLGRPDIAQIVVDALHNGDRELDQYRLHNWVIMSNHVHVLLTPLVPPSKLAQSLKGFTARKSNLLLGRTGVPFWQREGFDRWVRNDAEFRKISSYILRNPVAAGVAERPEDYRWSSAHEPA